MVCIPAFRRSATPSRRAGYSNPK